ncbi:MAG TPA: Tat pathway signal protein [Caulobacteraceae bacterium]|jgi:hypothetical protein|nr:Tat pathway signal protein [Caulobacteraceae bacterium]
MRRRVLLIAIACAAVQVPALGRAQEGGGSKAKPPYFQLPAVAVSIVRADGRRGVLTVEVGVDVKDPGLRNKIELYQPILTSAYVSALQPYALGLSPGAPPNADFIAMTLQRETDRVLGRRGAKLLLGSILVN